MNNTLIGIIATAMIAIIGVLIWYLKYQTKRSAKREDKHDAEQKEERLYNRGIIKGELKTLHQDSIKTAELSRKSIALQKSIGNKTITALNDLCNKINGKVVIKS